MNVFKVYVKINSQISAAVVGVHASYDGALRHASFARNRAYGPALVLESPWEELNEKEKELFHVSLLDMFTSYNDPDNRPRAA